MPNVKKKISWHLTDLLGRDVNVCHDVVTWLKAAPSELNQRKVNKRLMARYAAAKMILAAVEEGNSGLFTHILDRTEGKVADRLEVSERRSLTLHVDLGLGAYNQGTLPPQAVEYKAIAEHALDQQSSGLQVIGDRGQVVEDTGSTLRGNSEGGEGGE